MIDTAIPFAIEGLVARRSRLMQSTLYPYCSSHSSIVRTLPVARATLVSAAP